MLMVESTKGTGVITTKKEKDIKGSVIILSIRETMLKESLKDAGAISGKTENFMKDSGSTA